MPLGFFGRGNERGGRGKPLEFSDLTFTEREEEVIQGAIDRHSNTESPFFWVEGDLRREFGGRRQKEVDVIIGHVRSQIEAGRETTKTSPTSNRLPL